MLNNISTFMEESLPDYRISDSNLPFSQYIALNQALIEERRTDLHLPGVDTEFIITANSPYECYPQQPILSGNRIKYGVLLLHGLLDCPFSLKDLGQYLQQNGILSRSILLPGHGTTPSDLLSVSYHDWIQALRYGVESLCKDVDQVFLAGYSTGAALSAYQALQDTQLSGIILLAPAIRIKVPIKVVVAWHYLKRWMRVNNNEWIDKVNEIDYVKYLSITFNAVKQVSMLTDVLRNLRQNHTISCPIFMALSREDETISSHQAIDLFSSFHHQDSKLLLYTSVDHSYPDSRIITRLSRYPELRIKHFSHVSIPFSPQNPHYGQQGDYLYASHADKNFSYGAYNRIESNFLKQLHLLKLCTPHRTLTYNPDFDFMAEQIKQFIIR